MPSSTASLPVPIASSEVQAFAEEQGVMEYLPGVLALARRIFPVWPIKVFLEDDPEIANDWHIIFEVQVPDDATAESLVALDQRWLQETSTECPSTHIGVTQPLGVAYSGWRGKP